ncbi:MAG: ATP-binding cassette domain-containing protein [Myxococcota bacterium]|nr:ATP-binding cassette domain-containing protein [Myxococcota bacterium]
MIALEGVAKRFAGRLVLEPTTLSVAAGASLALVGPSGCGKSTLLRTVLGLFQPDEGRVSVGGILVTADTALAVRRRAGYVIQDGGLFPHLTARDNATLLARHLRWTADRIERRVAELASLTRLDRDTLSRYPGEISGGQRQRVGIMRALMLDPPVLLLDEPMGALDPMVRAKLQEDLKGIFLELGKTVLLVTHDLEEAAYLGNEVALMRAGRVLQRGSMRELIEAPADPFVREFVESQRPACR